MEDFEELLVVECPYCKANVSSSILGQHISQDQNDPSPFRTSLLACPKCGNTLVTGQYEELWPEHQGSWESPTRLWPSPKRVLDWAIPEDVRLSLEEADRCIKGNAYIASAVMSGRALEAVCRHFKTKSRNLGAGLKELLEREIIDKRLFQWSQELQKHRNLAAHASGEKIEPLDAEALLEFAVAICDYIFVFTKKFERFMERKQNGKKA